MDNSKEYILQCEKAEEIQHDELKIGDYISQKNFYEPIIISWRKEDEYVGCNDSIGCHCADCIWLPRQDQLQDLIEDNWKSDYPLYFLAMFIKFWKHYDEKYITKFSSMEQLWLAFVMKEKYSKQWDGKDWI